MDHMIDIVGIALTVISGYVGFLVKSISNRVDDLCKQISHIDGNTKEIRMWSEMHEKHDEERFARLDTHMLQKS